MLTQQIIEDTQPTFELQYNTVVYVVVCKKLSLNQHKSTLYSYQLVLKSIIAVMKYCDQLAYEYL